MLHRAGLFILAVAALAAFSPVAWGLEKISSGPQTSTERADPLGVAMTQSINALLEQQWTAGQVQPAPAADDAEFLRRACLDLTGVIPRASEVREFLADQRPDKREQLIDRLLASPRYATHMATTWRNRILPVELATQCPSMF